MRKVCVAIALCALGVSLEASADGGAGAAGIAIETKSLTQPAPDQKGSHTVWLQQLGAASLQSKRAALEVYDHFLRDHPDDATAAIERCDLIAGLASGDDDDTESAPELPSVSECLEGLEEDFPESASAILARLRYSFGEKALALAEASLADPDLDASDTERAEIYRKLSQSQQAAKKYEAAARSARSAIRLDPKLDLTAMLGEDLLALNRKTEAAVVLSSRPDGDLRTRLAKVKALADAGWFARAEWMMDLPGSTRRPDAALRARIYEGAGKNEQALAAYAEVPKWNQKNTLLPAFRLQLESGDAQAAFAAYQALRDQGLTADPVLHERLLLTLSFPASKWRARDLGGLFLLLLALLGVLLSPLILFVPIHAFSLWRRLQRPRSETAPAEPEWWFRHAYVASAIFVGAQCVAIYACAYDQLAELIRAHDAGTVVTPSLARFVVCYALLQSAALALMLCFPLRRWRLLGRGTWSIGKCIGQAALALLLVWIIGAVGARLFKLGGGAFGAITIDALVRSLVQSYGFAAAWLVVGVLIPIGEELVFRSILLDVLARHFKFWRANLFQALLFALMHANPSALFMYMTMGLLSGRMRRRSGGLLASILLHAANNTVVLLSMGATQLSVPQKKAREPVGTDSALVRCAPHAKDPGLGTLTTEQLNNLAWAVAIDPAASAECLDRAEDAVELALQHWPENPAYLDTKATLLYRERRYDEAIDLERAAANADADTLYFSQLVRFVKTRAGGGAPMVLGAGEASVSFTPETGALRLRLESPLPDGFVLYARAENGTVVQLSAGPRHENSYRIPLPVAYLGNGKFSLILIDTRGADGYTGAHWRYRAQLHDAAVDAYP